MQPKLKFAQRIKLFGRNWFDVTCRDVMQFPGGELREPWNKGRTWKQTTVNSGGEGFYHCDGIFLLKFFLYIVPRKTMSEWKTSRSSCGKDVSAILEELYSLSKFFSNGNWKSYRTFVESTVSFFSKLVSFWKSDKREVVQCIFVIRETEIIKLQFF